MKTRHFSLVIALCLMLAVPAFAYVGGIYTGTAQGLGGPVTVEVAVSTDRIESVTVTEQSESAGIATPALEKLPALIVERQSLALDAISGCTVTSGAILSAAETALAQAGADMDALKMPVEQYEQPGTTTQITTDVVIVGAGGAGLSASVAAADAGAKVVLLEKMGDIGGTTFTSQGLFGGYDTQIDKALGIELTYEQMYDNLMNNASYRLDPTLTTITVSESGKSIDWLIDRVSVPFLKDDVRVGYGPLQMMHVVDGGGMGMYSAFKNAIENADVDFHPQTRAYRILIEDGRITGVCAKNGNDELIVRANAVVLCTGGYSNNPDLTARLNPEMAGTFGIGFAGATGDGLIMASNVGALLTHNDHLMAVLKDYEIMSEMNGTSATANVSGFIGAPNLVLVGQDAKRFVDEKSGGYMTQELNSPIFDRMHRDNVGYVWAISDLATIEDRKIERGMGLEFVKADTIGELASKMELDAQALETTLNDYNSYVETGHDSEFGRLSLAKLNAPYCAVKVVPCEIITYGGVARDEQARVLRADGTIIHGLYAAGEVSASSAYMGFTLSNCVTWGRIAGTNAARLSLED